MTSRNNILVQLLFVFAVIAAMSCKPKLKPVESYFNVCSRSDQQKLNDCVKQTVTTAKATLKKGIPALGLVPLEPLIIPRMELNQGSGTFGLKTILTNFKINGLCAFEVIDANFVLDDKTLNFDLSMKTPELKMTAKYEMDGQILVIPIRGNGNCEMNFTDVVTVAHTTGRVVERNGDKYIELLNIKWDISINYEKSRMWFYNLFNGDKRLGDATNNFLNSNGEEAFQAVKHLPEEAFGQVFKDLSSKVYDVYPIKDLFRD